MAENRDAKRPFSENGKLALPRAKLNSPIVWFGDIRNTTGLESLVK